MVVAHGSSMGKLQKLEPESGTEHNGMTKLLCLPSLVALGHVAAIHWANIQISCTSTHA